MYIEYQIINMTDIKLSTLGSLRIPHGAKSYDGKTGTWSYHDLILRDVFLNEVSKNQVPVLKAWSKALNIPGTSKMRKAELVHVLENMTRAQREAVVSDRYVI